MERMCRMDVRRMMMILVSIGVLAGAATAEEGGGETRSVVFKSIDGVELRAHIFEPPDLKPTDKRSAAGFFFGGGWTGGTPKQFYPHCEYLASRGMVAVSFEYRVKKTHGTSPFECVKDGRSAIRWMRANASELGIDPDRVVAGGGSAGGHVAATTAVITKVNEATDDLAVSATPDALLLFNPVIDTTEKGYGAEKVKGRETELSPTHHVTKDLPPTLIFHGTEDTTVPFENVERFTRLMKEAGNRCELVPFEGKKHGFFNKSRDLEAFEETIRVTDAFLVSLHFLEAPQDAQ
ncbi:MAG: alpha/beta hydrolase fold domain-containing protein [bacterium]|nr:alpha/beta hydrolase fold domain-containing protein [bacterium]